MYFVFLVLNAYILKLDGRVVRFIGEVLTFPMLIASFIMLTISVRHVIGDKFKVGSYSFWSFIMMLICATSTLVSLIFKIG